MKTKQIKCFQSGVSNNGQVEREANEWIAKNKIDAVSIHSDYNFWNGYTCNVTYNKTVE